MKGKSLDNIPATNLMIILPEIRMIDSNKLVVVKLSMTNICATVMSALRRVPMM